MKKKGYNPIYLSKSAKILALTHERTEAEERALVEIMLYLKKLSYSGEIHCRAFLVNQNGKARRPDIYLPRYALPIEIDGRTRDSWQIRQEDIEPRDLFYKSLGTNLPLVIPASWVVSRYKMDRFKRELRNLLFTNKINPKQLSLIKTRLSIGRKIFETRYVGIFQCHGSLAPQFCHDLKGHDLHELRHFGGTKFILRSTYQTKKMDLQNDLIKFIYQSTKVPVDKQDCVKLHQLLFNRDLPDPIILDQIEDFTMKYTIDFIPFANKIFSLRKK